MRRAVVPLLAAPIALVFCAGNAAALEDPRPEYDSLAANDTQTAAECMHPTDERLFFDVYIETGKEHFPDGADVSGFSLQAADNGADVEWQQGPGVSARKLSWTYGELTRDGYTPTSATFYAGGGFQLKGKADSHFKVTDVMAMRFKAVWNVVESAATRTLTCTVRLDKFRYYPKYILAPPQ